MLSRQKLGAGGWHCGAVSRALDLRGFESQSGTRHKNSVQVCHIYVPLSPSSIRCYWPKNGDGDALRLGSKSRYGSCAGGR